MDYDLIIIGAGPAGYKAALAAAKQKLSVCVFDFSNIGGVCLNKGCIPLKSFLHVSSLKNDLCNLGITKHFDENFNPSISNLTEYNKKIIGQLQKNILSLFNHFNISYIKSKCSIQRVENQQVIVTDNNGEIYKGNNLIIATGSKPKQLNFNNMQTNYKVLYTDDAFEVSEYPKKMIVVGGGVAGLEFADFFNTMGTKVIVVEISDRIGGVIDKDISDILYNRLQQKGIDIRLNTKITEWKENSVILTESNSSYEINDISVVLISIGRIPNTNDLGLDLANVDVDEKGRIVVDEFNKSSCPNIFACGDVVGKKMLAHTAYAEAEVIIDNLMGKKRKIDYNLIPSIVYTTPEMASVGITEEYCQRNGITYKTAKLPFAYSSKYFIENYKETSLCKMMFDENNIIIGCEMVGNHVSELVSLVELFIAKKMSVTEISDFIYPHPSISEIFGDLAKLIM